VIEIVPRGITQQVSMSPSAADRSTATLRHVLAELRSVRRPLAASSSSVRMRWMVPITIFLVIAGCGVGTQQPESARTVAALEVPLPSEAGREQFLFVLRTAAEAEGMQVDAEDKQELENDARASPLLEKTMNAAVWRGANDDEAIASAMDQYDHLGKVWIMFFRGKDPMLSSRFRDRTVRAIKLQWPGTLSLPIMPTGAIPLNADLVQTPAGYVVKPSEAHRYQLKDSEKQRQ
jgi:hypothetical protein